MRPIALIALCLFCAPAQAGWNAANPAVEAAAKQPRIAGAIEAAMRFDQAILTHDVKAFADTFSDDAVVNNPFNRIARKSDAVANFTTGLIDYTTLDRVIEYAATRGAHDVVLMGEEHLNPVGKARFSGKHVKRRTTEVWSDESGTWKLVLRQATIYSAE